MTQEDTTQPTVTVYTDPQAGALATRLATAAIEPGLDRASATLGGQLAVAAQDAEDQARLQVEQQLAADQAQQARQAQQAAADRQAAAETARQARQEKEAQQQREQDNLKREQKARSDRERTLRESAQRFR